MSTAHKRPPGPRGKGEDAEAVAAARARWQHGKHPCCCRIFAERYQRTCFFAFLRGGASHGLFLFAAADFLHVCRISYKEIYNNEKDSIHRRCHRFGHPHV